MCEVSGRQLEAQSYGESLKYSSRADTRLHQFPSMGHLLTLLGGTAAHRGKGRTSTWALNRDAARARCPGQQEGADLRGHGLQDVGPGLPITPPLQSDCLCGDGKDHVHSLAWL